jgi:DNA-3-methyladenine glycosylase I
MKKRCQWPSEIELDYHDTEWGVPVTDDKKWFEYLLLDTFQAGLSWKIVLQKREGFRKLFTILMCIRWLKCQMSK